MSISNSFSTLLERIQPLESELQQAESHAASIKSRLEKQFKLVKFSRIGSHSKGTAVRRFSDIDFLTVFSRDDARWGGRYIDSRTLLNRVRLWLTGRFQQTAVRRDQQALVLRFSAGSVAVDVVPAFFEGMDQTNGHSYPVFSIPDGTGTWLPTSPEMHGRYFNEADDASISKLARTVQLLKFWRSSRIPPVPLSSFHIELLLASEGICVGPKSYAQCLAELFNLLAERQCRPLRDPLRISGIIPATKTEPQRSDLLTSVSNACDRAFRALEAEAKGKTIEAKRLWNLVFYNRFPLYG
ncbi:MAG: nucleotidyltransferase [Ignavibacteriales bacterium]|nr:nucleotidyltransferase [Ignavibacteriales bacterium]